MEAFNLLSVSNNTTPAFNGSVFYEVYKDAEFLRHDKHVAAILAKGFLVRKKVNNIPIGESMILDGLHLENNTPLIIKRAGKGVTVEDFEFTYNRLCGLVAAYAFENRQRFPILETSEAKTLGLTWDHNIVVKAKIYLSAVSGTENMIKQFSYFPLLCGIRKYYLKKMPIELVVAMGHVKNDDGVSMAQLMMKNFKEVSLYWSFFPKAKVEDFKKFIDSTPELVKLFRG